MELAGGFTSLFRYLISFVFRFSIKWDVRGMVRLSCKRAIVICFRAVSRLRPAGLSDRKVPATTPRAILFQFKIMPSKNGQPSPNFRFRIHRNAQPNRITVRRYTAIDSRGQLRTFRVHMTALCEKTSIVIAQVSAVEDYVSAFEGRQRLSD